MVKRHLLHGGLNFGGAYFQRALLSKAILRFEIGWACQING